MISLGCAKNQVDSEMILGVCKHDLTLVKDACDADVIIVNTCAFIEPARKEAIDTILSLADQKKSGCKLIVCGCLPQRYKGDLEKLLPEVDRFISIDEYGNIGSILNSVLNSNYKFNDSVSFTERFYSTPSYMRYVRISDGCLNHCAFCAIPLIRGRLKSRTIESIVDEVKMDVADGVYEINLISQDTTKYGFDIYKRLALVDLLKELIPIQHSEDKLLKKMYRRGDRAFMLDLFKKIRKEIPTSTIRTTLIVGFPYEEKEDVLNLIEFMNEVKFDRLGAFTFSLEENTKACDYPQEITEAEKQRRYDMVMAAQQKIIIEKNKALVGSVIKDAFIIGYDEDSFMYVARSDAYAPDEIDGCIYVAAKYELKLGQRVNVKILDSDEYSLTGEQVE